MKKLTQEQFNRILRRHEHYLAEDCKGWEQMQANFGGLDLAGINMYDADLSKANFSFANLSKVYLCNARLVGACFEYANLSDASLEYADLTGADLYGADLSEANLDDANLTEAALYAANFTGASLDRANLTDVKFSHKTVSLHQCCPEEGSFIAFKKAVAYRSRDTSVIVKLQVPAKAKRSSATTRKCRVSEAKVLEITSPDKKKIYTKARAEYDRRFIYEVGKTVKVKNFDTCRWNECAPGIHCFLTREEAIQY